MPATSKNERHSPQTSPLLASHSAIPEPDGAAEVVRALSRFLRIVRHRKSYVITSLLIAAFLGGLYYLTATRLYEATAQLLITQSGSDVWNASAPTGSQHDSLLLTYERIFSSKVVLNGAIERLDKLAPEARIDVADKPKDKWADALEKNLSAKLVRRTNIIELVYKSRSPRAAEAVVGALVESYLDFMEKNHRDISVEIIAILEKDRKEKENELRLKQQQLLKVKQLVGDLALPNETDIIHPVVQRVVKLNETLVEAQKERLQLEASLVAIQSAIQTGGDLRQHLLSVEPAVGRELILNAMGLSPQAVGLVNTIERKLLADRAKLQTLREHLGPTHPEIQELFRSITNAEQHIANHQNALNSRMSQIQGRKLGETLLGMVGQKLAAARNYEEQLRRQYKIAEQEAVRMNGRLAELQIVQNEVERLSNLHDMLLDRIANIDLKQEGDDVRVAIVSEPESSGRPISPKLSVVGLLCLISGSGAGIIWIYILDLLDDRFRSPDEIKEQLGMPVLAMVRKLADLGENGADSIMVHNAAASVESEAFRTLRTTLTFSGQELQRIAITSSAPGDGKTTVLANLGASYAQAGKRTLLLDCDLRRPGLTKLFQLRAATGVSNILRGQDDLATMAANSTLPTGIEGLDILACGPKPPNPSELLISDRFMELVAWAEVNYDQVLIDCPPVMAASDAAIVGRLVDGMMLVVQPEKNHRRLVLRAAEHLVSMQVNMLGVVANRVDEDTNGYGYGYGGGYGYGEGYGLDDPDDEHADVTPFESPHSKATPKQVTPRRRSA